MTLPRKYSLIETYLDVEGRVMNWPGKKKRAEQVLILRYLAGKFEQGTEYSEMEVNEILKKHHTFQDWALLRREIVELGLLNREKNGSKYWITSTTVFYDE